MVVARLHIFSLTAKRLFWLSSIGVVIIVVIFVAKHGRNKPYAAAMHVSKTTIKVDTFNGPFLFRRQYIFPFSEDATLAALYSYGNCYILFNHLVAPGLALPLKSRAALPTAFYPSSYDNIRIALDGDLPPLLVPYGMC